MSEPARQNRNALSGSPGDPIGDESGEDAHIWTIYAREATQMDNANVTAWNGSLDALLIFAGLFSAVTTAFIIESYKLLQPDYTQETFFLLAASLAGNSTQNPNTARSHSSVTSRAVNFLWISSLIISLTAALVSILAKEWLFQYRVAPGSKDSKWAELRQLRYNALHAYKVPEIIAFLPSFLHVSLLLFFSGLVVFLIPIDEATGTIALILSACAALIYMMAVLMPLIQPTSPFQTQLTPILLKTLTTFCFWISADYWDIAKHFNSAMLLSNAISWLDMSVHTTEVSMAILQVLGDMNIGTVVGPLLSMQLKDRILYEMQQIKKQPMDMLNIALYFRAAISFGSEYVAKEEMHIMLTVFAHHILSADQSSPSTLGDITVQNEVGIIAACYLSRSLQMRTDHLLQILSQSAHIIITPRTFKYVMQTLEAIYLTRTIPISIADGYSWLDTLIYICKMASGWTAHFHAHPSAMQNMINIAVSIFPHQNLVQKISQLRSATPRSRQQLLKIRTRSMQSQTSIKSIVSHTEFTLDGPDLCHLIDILSTIATDPKSQLSKLSLINCLVYLCALHDKSSYPNCSGHVELANLATLSTDWKQVFSGIQPIALWLRAIQIDRLSCHALLLVLREIIPISYKNISQPENLELHDEVLTFIKNTSKKVLQSKCPAHSDRTVCSTIVLINLLSEKWDQREPFAALNAITHGRIVLDIINALNDLHEKGSRISHLLKVFLDTKRRGYTEPWNIQALCSTVLRSMKDGVGESNDDLEFTIKLYSGVHLISKIIPEYSTAFSTVAKSMVKFIKGPPYMFLKTGLHNIQLGQHVLDEGGSLTLSKTIVEIRDLMDQFNLSDIHLNRGSSSFLHYKPRNDEKNDDQLFPLSNQAQNMEQHRKPISHASSKDIFPSFIGPAIDDDTYSAEYLAIR